MTKRISKRTLRKKTSRRMSLTKRTSKRKKVSRKTSLRKKTLRRMSLTKRILKKTSRNTLLTAVPLRLKSLLRRRYRSALRKQKEAFLLTRAL